MYSVTKSNDLKAKSVSQKSELDMNSQTSRDIQVSYNNFYVFDTYFKRIIIIIIIIILFEKFSPQR